MRYRLQECRGLALPAYPWRRNNVRPRCSKKLSRYPCPSEIGSLPGRCYRTRWNCRRMESSAPAPRSLLPESGVRVRSGFGRNRASCPANNAPTTDQTSSSKGGRSGTPGSPTHNAKRPDKQRRCREQDERERNLRNHQGIYFQKLVAAKWLPLRSSARARDRFLEL